MSSTKLAQKYIPLNESAQRLLMGSTDEKYNTINVALYYDPDASWNRPRGYYLHINQVSRTAYGFTMTIGWGDDVPKSYIGLVKQVSRRSKKADAEAIALFNAFYPQKIVEMYGADACDLEKAS